MGFLFGDFNPPQPAPVPTSPAAPSNVDAERARQDAERAAIAESKAAGRRQTIVAGYSIAKEEQAERGLLSQKRRRASREIVG